MLAKVWSEQHLRITHTAGPEPMWSWTRRGTHEVM